MRESGQERAAPVSWRKHGKVCRGSANRRAAPVGLAVLLAVWLAGQPARGQPVEEYQFKAAILYNLAKFVEWPPDVLRSPNQAIVICVLGDSPIHDVLKQAVGGKQIENHGVAVRRVSQGSEASSCQILFIPADRTRWRDALSGLKSGGILTVGENSRFVGEGGVANLKTEGGKVRIQINVEAARRERLTISSKLLALAQILGK